MLYAKHCDVQNIRMCKYSDTYQPINGVSTRSNSIGIICKLLLKSIMVSTKVYKRKAKRKFRKVNQEAM